MVVPNLKTNEKNDVGFTCNRLRAGTNSKTCIFFERQKSDTVGRSVGRGRANLNCAESEWRPAVAIIRDSILVSFENIGCIE